MKKGKIIGIGGIFFRTQDPTKTKEWYNSILGVKTDEWGAAFVSRKHSKANESAYLQWSPFPADTDYFGKSGQEFMVNYRVDDIVALVNRLRSEGVRIIDEIASYDYGKFVHIEDQDGRLVELWEPIDSSFDKFYQGKELNVE